MDEDAMLAELLNPQFRAVPGAASPGTSQAVTPDGSFFLPQDELLSADGMDPFLRALEAEDRTLEEKLREYDAKYGSPEGPNPYLPLQQPAAARLSPALRPRSAAAATERNARNASSHRFRARDPAKERLPTARFTLFDDLGGGAAPEGDEENAAPPDHRPGPALQKQSVASGAGGRRKKRSSYEAVAKFRQLAAEKERFGLRLAGQTKAIKVMTLKLQGQGDELRRVQTENEKLRQSLRLSRNDNALLVAQKEEAMRQVRADQGGAEKQVQAFLDEIAALKRRLRHLSEKEGGNAQRNAALLQRLKDAQREAQGAVRDRDAARANAAEIAASAERAKVLMKHARERLRRELEGQQALRDAAARHEAQLGEVNGQLSQLRAKLKQVVADAGLLKKEADGKAQALAKKQAELARAEAGMRELASELHLLKTEQAFRAKPRKPARARAEPAAAAAATAESRASAAPAPKGRKGARAAAAKPKPKGRRGREAPQSSQRGALEGAAAAAAGGYDSDSSSDMSWDGIYKSSKEALAKKGAESPSQPVQRRQHLRQAKSEYKRIMSPRASGSRPAQKP